MSERAFDDNYDLEPWTNWIRSAGAMWNGPLTARDIDALYNLYLDEWPVEEAVLQLLPVHPPGAGRRAFWILAQALVVAAAVGVFIVWLIVRIA